MSFDLLVWKAPRVHDGEEARALADQWLEDPSSPESGPFQRSADVRRFYDALMARYPALETFTEDELRTTPPVTHWSETPEPSDRVVVMSFSWSVPGEVIDEVTGLAREHGLVLYDPQGPDVHLPDAEPSGTPFGIAAAIWAALVGTMGTLLAAVAWLLSIPLLSGVLVVVGAFLAVMAVATLVHEGRTAWRTRA